MATAAAPASPVVHISLPQWLETLGKQDTRFSKSQVADLVLNYLVVEGYKEAAEQFLAERNADANALVDLAGIGLRQAVRMAIQQGNIDAAIDLLNQHDISLLDRSPRLFVHLCLQRMIEAVRGGKALDAISIAQNELAGIGVADADLLRQVEDVLLLTVFDPHEDALQPCVQSLMAPSQRLKTANEINEALLASEGFDQGIFAVQFCIESKLPVLLRAVREAQEKLGQRVPRLEMTTMPSGELQLQLKSAEAPSSANNEQEYAMEIDATAIIDPNASTF